MSEKKPSEPIALIDMDGTVADYDKGMTTAMRAICAPGEELYWHDDAPSYMIERKRLIQSVPGFWRNLPQISLGMDIVETLREIGFALNVLTKGPTNRSTNAWSEKVEWCKEYLPGVPVTVTQDKGLVYGKILVDDWPSYVLRWLEWRPRGQVFMPAQPWNKDFVHPNVIRVWGGNFGEVRHRAADIMEQLKS